MTHRDGRSPGWPDDWQPTTAAEVAEALIAELRNALVPVRYRMRRDGSAELRQVERVLEMADVCAARLESVAVGGWRIAAVGPCVWLGTQIQHWEIVLVNPLDSEDAVIKQVSDLTDLKIG